LTFLEMVLISTKLGIAGLLKDIYIFAISLLDTTILNGSMKEGEMA